ncbi:DUF5686 and carboxypeptidase regulatory-like domain-containing protein [Aestuariibaculum sp. M13]|uniref:DUF5686 and carboxypeptidase-like regulatory domain-containing protein n=1 Tax=Aestuariibaculum sp. M13 TaxID=2967132 RepID=UPI00215A06E8|nr:DUF5686 and carboxypeptidase-like regulatory domain-containing protein [Aestuariibaculum sp. M13]MCR8668802.1 DUF5686 and carboxypeptidase regulatory-like domain-containing protein [Aestuariibaculum sp. M13]
MNLRLLFIFFYFGMITAFAQTKVSGYVFDEYEQPVSFANVLFQGSTKGTITDENGKFYLESDETWDALTVSFIGYETLVIPLEKKVNYNLKFILKEEAAQLDQVLIVSGKQSKKNNPAIDILRKIWEHKRKNGLRLYNQYQYDKYEKVEFDINTIDSALIKSKLFRGMEFVFEEVDTSNVTGKTYLPIFINEAVSTVYGDNVISKEKEVLNGNKNSGFSDNQVIIDFVDDLYSDYNIYDNYMKFFDKSFVSPLSRTGINTYNYVLMDSAYIDDKWCYNIKYYPRRKNELTFKGDFWVADSTYAIKEINLQASKSANINWVKDIYIEQEFEVVSDSVFLVKRDYMMSDFAFKKKEEARGIYGKRTTLFNNYKFDITKDKKFYEDEVFNYDQDVYDRDDAFWDANRMEALNKDEKGVYKMLDTLKTVKKFKHLYNLGSILTSGYIEFNSLPLDYGPIFSTFGFNEVEGVRIRTGGRTYFGKNDLWRLEGYLAYGFKDDKFKYGFSGKWLLDKKNRFIISAGNRRDVEQIGVNLTTNTDVLGRSFASSGLITTGPNDKLTSINLTSLYIETEPLKNVVFKIGGNYRTLESASPTFSLDYNTEDGIVSEIKQFESSLSVSYFPKRKMTGFGVERLHANDDYASLFAQVTRGDKEFFNSDFDYTKLQFSYTQPWQIGGFGRLTTVVEAGKTIGEVPLGLLSIVPGNQSYFSIYNTFSQLDYYEFVTDTYASFHVEHNFNGRLFSRIPFLRKLNWREIVSFRSAWGELSDENIALNTTDNPYAVPLIAPSNEIYYEYGFGIGNIFKVFRIDFNFRGNYFDNPDARKFGVTGTFGFYF